MILIFEKRTAIKIIDSIFGCTVKIQQFCLKVTRKNLKLNGCQDGYQLQKSYLI